MPAEFTDDELAFLRHVRFGELPARVPTEKLVPLVETDPPPDNSADETFSHLKNSA